MALAQILAEDASPPDELWRESLIASRLTEYETRNRLQAHGLAVSHGAVADDVLARVSFLELVPPVAARAGSLGEARTLDGSIWRRSSGSWSKASTCVSRPTTGACWS